MNSFKNPSGEIDVLSVELTPPIGELGEPVYFYETRDLLKLISVLLSSCSTEPFILFVFLIIMGRLRNPT
jgi:hypothetical protein